MTNLNEIRQVLEPIPDSHGQNLYSVDEDLQGLLRLYLEPDLYRHLLPHLHRLGQLAGSTLETLASSADKHPPELVVRTRQGHDHSDVIKHPAYIELERWAFSEFGLAAAAHAPGVLGWHEPLPPIGKYVLFYLFTQAEFGLTCPLNMTDSLTRTLKKYGHPDLVNRYLARLTSLDFDNYFQGAMFMTEQGAGSDIAQTATRASRDGSGWKLYGDKWFCSNATADLAMVLARPDEAPDGMAGVTLFLMPRIKDDGTMNDYRIIRLKDKLGTRAMPSGEIRLEGAQAYLIGEIGRGFQQMAEMVNSSRLSNGIRAGALMRRAVSEARYVAHHRHAFGKRLIDLPLMKRQLSKMLLPTEQARSFGFQIADILVKADKGDVQAQKLVRIMTPLIKFRACRDARKVAGDALEVQGGCGYIEEWIEPRLVRESHLGSIWEGTSNIVALDVFRAARREGALDAYANYCTDMLANLPPALVTKLRTRLDAIVRATQLAIDEHRDEWARELSSCLYDMGCAIIFAWESTHEHLEHRQQLCLDVIEHRLDPRMTRLGIFNSEK